MNSIRPSRLHFAACIIFLAAWLYPCPAFADTCEQWIAKAVSVQGNVEVQRAGETQWQTVKLEDTFCPGDTIRVDDRSRADLSLVNQPVLRLDQNTTLTLGGVKEDRGSVVELAKGAIHFFSRIRRNLEVQTGFVNAGVEGTEGANAGTKTYRVVENLERLLAIEFMTAAQAMEFRRPARTGSRLEEILARYRQVVPPLESDRVLSDDLHRTVHFLSTLNLATIKNGAATKNGYGPAGT